MKEDDIFGITVRNLQELFDECNDKYFHGECKPLPIKVNRSTTKAGAFHCGVDWTRGKFVARGFVFTNAYEMTYSQVRDTMVHEMLHYYDKCYSSEYPPEKFARLKWLFFSEEMSKTDIFKSLGMTQETAHQGFWERTAKLLNSEYPELHIVVHNGDTMRMAKSRADSMSRTCVAYLLDSPKKDAVKLILLRRNSVGNMKFEQLLKALGNNTYSPYRSNVRGPVYELDLDWSLTKGYTVFRDMNRCYGAKALADLEQTGAILGKRKIADAPEELEEAFHRNRDRIPEEEDEEDDSLPTMFSIS